MIAKLGMTEPNSLKNLQGQLRLTMLDMYKRVNAGHIGCALSCIDILIASLVLRKTENDDFILSKGHAAAALYACLNYRDEISDDELMTYYKNGTSLPAHPVAAKYGCIPFATGSLGHGLPISCGIAKANKMNKNAGYAYVVMSDGETNEGTTWEASHFAVAHKLDNLIAIIDRNGIQGFGNTKNILGDTASPGLWKNLGYDIIEVDGHHVEEMISAIDELKGLKNNKPKLIIANTVKGKGVSFMENEMAWHYLPMDDGQFEKAKQEIQKKYLS